MTKSPKRYLLQWKRRMCRLQTCHTHTHTLHTTCYTHHIPSTAAPVCVCVWVLPTFTHCSAAVSVLVCNCFPNGRHPKHWPHLSCHASMLRPGFMSYHSCWGLDWIGTYGCKEHNFSELFSLLCLPVWELPGMCLRIFDFTIPSGDGRQAIAVQT